MGSGRFIVIQLYRKLAVINMKSDRRFYLPYLLTGIISAAMFYLVMAMQDNGDFPVLAAERRTFR